MEIKPVIFDISGESPDTGRFTKDEERELPVKAADLFILRGICHAAPGKALKPAASGAKKEEVKENV